MIKNLMRLLAIFSLILLTGSLTSDNTAYAADFWSGISSGDTFPAMWDPSGTDKPFNGTVKGTGKQIFVSAPKTTKKFTGTGPGTTPSFYLPAGTTQFHITYQGDDYFSTWLYHTDGTLQDWLVAAIGNYDKTISVTVPAGNYYIEMRWGLGSWSIKF